MSYETSMVIELETKLSALEHRLETIALNDGHPSKDLQNEHIRLLDALKRIKNSQCPRCGEITHTIGYLCKGCTAYLNQGSLQS